MRQVMFRDADHGLASLLALFWPDDLGGSGGTGGLSSKSPAQDPARFVEAVLPTVLHWTGSFRERGKIDIGLRGRWKTGSP